MSSNMHDVSIKTDVSLPILVATIMRQPTGCIGQENKQYIAGVRSVSWFSFIFGGQASTCVTQMMNQMLKELRLKKRSMELLKSLRVHGAKSDLVRNGRRNKCGTFCFK